MGDSKKESKCPFDRNGVCYALACYNGRKCNSRDESENPIYASVEEIEKEERKKVNKIITSRYKEDEKCK